MSTTLVLEENVLLGKCNIPPEILLQLFISAAKLIFLREYKVKQQTSKSTWIYKREAQLC